MNNLIKKIIFNHKVKKFKYLIWYNTDSEKDDIDKYVMELFTYFPDDKISALQIYLYNCCKSHDIEEAFSKTVREMHKCKFI